MQKTDLFLAAAAHVSYLLFGIGFLIVPLLIYIFSKNDFVVKHAAQAMKAQFLMVVICFVCIVIASATAPAFIYLYFLFVAIWIVCSIIAAVKALNGDSYTYPCL